jgi:redox-sensitive bicupin YhaK (pirin superfamily)
VSNLESAPAELTCPATARPPEEPGRLLEAREVPLGGPRAMPVRRTLPQRERTMIGSWCFVDHYGPDDVRRTGGMRVAGHPHTGLQTASWLFGGEVEHRDTLGTHAYVRPGELNLMTAGSGIAHSEYSTPETSVLHGAQLWIALPDRHRFVHPAFERYAPTPVEERGARVLVFLGALLGEVAPVRTYTPLLGAEITLPAGRTLELPVNPAFEHGLLVDTGELRAGGVLARPGQLIDLPAGSRRLSIEAAPARPARALLLGGEPLGESIVMWWNFIGRGHDEIVEYRERWQRQRADASSGSGAGGPYGPFPEQWSRTLPAPPLPGSRLNPRR